MYESVYPIFEPGRVLKLKSVEFLRDFPYNLASLTFEEYSDGILFGFSVSLENGRFAVTKGAVKYQGQIILIPGIEFTFEDYGRLLHTRLVIHECRREADWESRKIEVKLTPECRLAANEMELGRFTIARGAVLRCKYDSISDFSTQDNTLDITHVRYAGLNTQTLHPKILKEFARIMLASSSDTADIAFGLMCLNANIIHKESIEWYLAKKSKCAYKTDVLEEIYKKLTQLAPRKGTHKDPGISAGPRVPIID